MIYNSRNYKGVLIQCHQDSPRTIYNSRNYKGVLIWWTYRSRSRIYNSRNYKGVLISKRSLNCGRSTTVEIIREY